MPVSVHEGKREGAVVLAQRGLVITAVDPLRTSVTEDEILARFGLRPPAEALPEIRQLLIAETAKERRSQGEGDTDLMRVCCVQLFFAGTLADTPLIWSAKSASMDANGAIDVQMLCGPGLRETKAYLRAQPGELALGALTRILEGEAWGEFEDFSVEAEQRRHAAWYGLELEG
ncbi:hypothetical protein [Enhygromyxa salina]|uniref:hypothetical protein n=1 Tax=Enhygromyxa salina TaxID=215803 RepID=UPI001969D2D5|nr:hypothetical protein [Enhygromyxa salina]